MDLAFRPLMARLDEGVSLGAYIWPNTKHEAGLQAAGFKHGYAC